MARCLLALAVLGVFTATLLPEEAGHQVAWKQVFCVLCTRTAAADALANIALFLPLGMALRLLGYTPGCALLLAAGLSLSVELAQFAIPGRDPSLGDFIFNSIGAAVGGGFLRRAPGWVRPGVRQASRLSLLAAVATGSVFAMTDVLLQPSLPEIPYFGGSPQVQPSDRPLRLGSNTEPQGHFQGRIDDVRIHWRARSASEIRADMNSPLGAHQGSSDLAAAYNFDEGSGAMLTDVSGHGNTGQITGARWTSQGKFGGALDFDGVRDVVIVPHSSSLNLANAMTLEAWIYPTAAQSGWRAVLQKEFDVYFLFTGSGAGALRPGGGGTFGLLTEILAAPAVVPTNVWTHMAMVYDGSTLELYVNGGLVRRRLRWYPGRVIESSVDGVTIPAGVVAESRRLRERLLSGAPVRVRAVAAAPVAAQAPLVTLHDSPRNEILLLAIEGNDVVFRLRTRAAAAALDNPALRARGVMRQVAPGDALMLTVRRTGRSYCVDVNTRSTCDLGFTIGMGWTFLAYSQVPPGWLHPALNGTWVAALLFPFGFWSRRRRASLLGALVLATGVAMSSALGNLTVPPLEIGAAIVGLVSGWGCRAITQYLQVPTQTRD